MFRGKITKTFAYMQIFFAFCGIIGKKNAHIRRNVRFSLKIQVS